KHVIKSETNRRRAKHAVYENVRTIEALEKLRAGDLKAFGELMNASHDSLQHDYEVTGAELDTLVETARKQDGVIGARMTGAGFGGCAIALVEKDKVDHFKQNVNRTYRDKIGYDATFYTAMIGDGAKKITEGEIEMRVLVLGRACYIGSHAVYQLIDQQKEVVVIDNLQTGQRDAIHPDATFYEGDIRDIDFLRDVFKNESIDAVIHFAANSLVGESMDIPLTYFDNNVYGTQILLQVMNEYQVKKIVFSSTAATYGEPESVPITEEMNTNPTSTYGETKLIMEKMMKWCEQAYGIKYISLRYF